jgi:phage terminase small subunit
MLTAKQTKFVEEVSEGGSQSSAYRKAYATSQMAPKTVWEEASRLRKHPKVAARIVELEAEKEARRRMPALSREDRILPELEDIAFSSANAMARLRALELLGKTVGLFKPKEVPEVERSAEDVTTEIHKRLAALLE